MNSKILNDSGEVVFSKFDFLEVKKEFRLGIKVKNYLKLLVKVEVRKKKLEILDKEDVEKVKEFKEKYFWS